MTTITDVWIAYIVAHRGMTNESSQRKGKTPKRQMSGEGEVPLVNVRDKFQHELYVQPIWRNS